MRKSKEEYQAELDYVVKTLLLIRDSDYLPMILKEERIRKFLGLMSLSILDLENLSFTLTNKENMKLDYC